MERKLDSVFRSMVIFFVFGFMMHILARVVENNVNKDVAVRLERIEAKLDASAKDTKKESE